MRTAVVDQLRVRPLLGIVVEGSIMGLLVPPENLRVRPLLAIVVEGSIMGLLAPPENLLEIVSFHVDDEVTRGAHQTLVPT